eukprot:sb/3468305/
MYTGSSARIKLLGKLTETIEVNIGTEQGHPLSPELFKMYVHELSVRLNREAGSSSPSLAGKHISHLLWADDLVLMALNPASLQRLINVLEEYCEEWGLSVNLKKTEVMVFNKSAVKLKESEGFIYKGQRIPSAKTYCYLGVTFTLNGSFKLNEVKLKQKALRAVFSIKKQIDFSAISPRTALKLFDSLVLPVASYCSQRFPGRCYFRGWRHSHLVRSPHTRCLCHQLPGLYVRVAIAIVCLTLSGIGYDTYNYISSWIVGATFYL